MQSFRDFLFLVSRYFIIFLKIPGKYLFPCKRMRLIFLPLRNNYLEIDTSSNYEMKSRFPAHFASTDENAIIFRRRPDTASGIKSESIFVLQIKPAITGLDRKMAHWISLEWINKTYIFYAPIFENRWVKRDDECKVTTRSYIFKCVSFELGSLLRGFTVSTGQPIITITK